MKLKILSGAEIASISRDYDETQEISYGLAIAKAQARLTAKQIVGWIEKHNLVEMMDSEMNKLEHLELDRVDWQALKELTK